MPPLFAILKNPAPFPCAGFFFAPAGSFAMVSKSGRNREIFAAFEAGRSVESLGSDYTLTINRVRSLRTDERHKRVVSLEPFYRSLRGT
jgi:Mor family transcriptional regulator